LTDGQVEDARVNGSSSLGSGTSGVGNFAVVLRRVTAASIVASSR
jgi:hypothetical protein